MMNLTTDHSNEYSQGPVSAFQSKKMSNKFSFQANAGIANATSLSPNLSIIKSDEETSMNNKLPRFPSSTSFLSRSVSTSSLLPSTEIEGRKEDNDDVRALKYACILTTTFFVIELVGGYIAKSLAIMTDAAHLLSDLSGFIISIIAAYVSRLPANSTFNFGFARAQVIGSLVSLFFIWSLTACLVIFAIIRIFNPEPVDGPLMLGLGIVGLIINIMLTTVLGHDHHHHDHDHGHGHGHCHAHSHHSHVHSHERHSHGVHGHGNCHEEDHLHGHSDSDSHELIRSSNYGSIDENDTHIHISCQQSSESKAEKSFLEKLKQGFFGSDIENMAVRAAYIHALGDLLQSIGVIIAAIIITINPRLKIFDPLCTLLFAILVIMTTTGLAKDSLTVLMEGAPQSIDLNEVYLELKNMDGVVNVRKLHIWSTSLDNVRLSVHVNMAAHVSRHLLMQKIKKRLSSKFRISNTTIEMNSVDEHLGTEEIYLGLKPQEVESS